MVVVGGGHIQEDRLIHSKQLKHFRPLNPDRERGKRGRESQLERDVMIRRGQESLFPSGR